MLDIGMMQDVLKNPKPWGTSIHFTCLCIWVGRSYLLSSPGAVKSVHAARNGRSHDSHLSQARRSQIHTHPEHFFFRLWVASYVDGVGGLCTSMQDRKPARLHAYLAANLLLLSRAVFFCSGWRTRCDCWLILWRIPSSIGRSAQGGSEGMIQSCSCSCRRCCCRSKSAQHNQP